MSNTTLAYYMVKTPASILNGCYRFGDGYRQLRKPVIGVASGLSRRSITLRLLILALILLLGGFAQAQRPAATHIVKPGETLGVIAQQYGVDIGALASANGINNAHLIHSWQLLQIPSSYNPQPAAQASDTHIVGHGETLGSIAEKYGASVYELQKANNIWSWMIYVGEELVIPGGKPVVEREPPATLSTSTDSAATEPENATVESSGITHTVRFGESLAKIALDYGVSLADLRTLNDVWTPIIYVGDELEIPAGAKPTVEREPLDTLSTSTDSAAPEPENATVESSGITHTVQFGESLAKIALDYGVSLTDLMTLNDVWTPIIYVGDELEIPAGGKPVVEREPLATLSTSTDSAAPEPESATVASSGIKHTVRFGESLAKIALEYGVSLADLRTLNDVWTPIIYVGDDLEIPAGGTAPDEQDIPSVLGAPGRTAAAPPADTWNPSSSQMPSTHTVQRGETLFRIAKRYGISVNSLMSVNGIQDPARIHAGNQLRLSQLSASAAPPVSNDGDSPISATVQAPAPAPAPANHGSHERYVVRRGDILTQLAIDLSTSWIALAQLNNLADPNNLHVGTALLIPRREDVERYDPGYAAWKYFDMIGHQPGPRIGSGREIVIVLGTQSAYAYENGVLQKAARVSAGKRATPTIKGDHKIWLKRRSQTMSGPGYSLDNVEWVMYFYQDYAIHGAWWHMNFGQPMSHGCVNLTNADAQWFYNFASIGTPVYVRS